MNEMSVGVRELKTRLSEYLRQVKTGQTIVITEHGQPVGRIVPATRTIDARLRAMVQAGLIAWSGKKLSLMAPVARAHGERSVADLLVEDRE
ncbi:MAG: type II toxin-antitoxin system prevent-host-death family antitoxin [Thermoflexales bacterium]|nr:type II toxin-antitoxin system prevent-host-death family antitoxin [Thermoflexales bacterium]